MLPASKLDQSAYPRGPWGMARFCEHRIAELEAARAGLPRSERRPVNQHLHTLRGLLRFAKSRRGYVEPPGSDVARETAGPVDFP